MRPNGRRRPRVPRRRRPLRKARRPCPRDALAMRWHRASPFGERLHPPGSGSPSRSASAPLLSFFSGGSRPASRDTRYVSERLVLLDSNSLIYRPFFAVPPLTTTQGELANATFGFASILLKSLEHTSPPPIAPSFDLPVPTFRPDSHGPSKATTSPIPT